MNAPIVMPALQNERRVLAVTGAVSDSEYADGPCPSTTPSSSGDIIPYNVVFNVASACTHSAASQRGTSHAPPGSAGTVTVLLLAI